MTALVVTLLVSAAAIPAVGACCAVKPAGLASMHASMPCCAESCQLKTPARASVPDEAIAPASAGLPSSPVGVTVVLADTPRAVTALLFTDDPFAVDSSPPAPFLLHSQFRI